MSRLHENPFASSTPSVVDNPFDDPTTATSAFHQQEPGSAAARQAELDRRERELAAREAQLNQRADHIRKHGRNNFPPFFPLIFHSIKDEIPETHQETVTRIFQLWLVLEVTLIVNLVAMIFVKIAGGGDSGDLGGAITYLPIIGVLSFLLWYRPVYNAYMKDQSLYFYIYFFFCGWHLLYSIYMVIGIPGTGTAGIITTVISFQKGRIVAGVLCVIACTGWTIQTAGHAFYYKKTWDYHTQAGHTLDKAKGELAANGAKSYFSRG
ncbi:related to secretory carrier-associated membrane protein 2 [Serendipita indica DSM 11827]|uniref:Related to secretory carrier-associated membrane protein 2 n=1 Tax=Serendipita indica (strain DSM 11827) TaxID=1109443 RepID=G4U2X8_SERID|nr:related to secretory carrier-associated membrane protein 2 [Serendipita indica DSM 11827]